ncbi:MAG: ABC transporter ATP-binding protein [Verrucomicrobiota bacterium]
MSTEPILKVKEATKAYRKGRESVPVFEDLDFSTTTGEFTALMGPSGSGKTTLLHSIGGLERLTSGSIRVGDREITRESEARLSKWRSETVGFVFQFYNLMPMLTARSNIELPLQLTSLGRKERRRQVDSALDIVGMSHRGKHRPRELSGGEQQRVAIARAIVSDPPLLLCDEPTGDLDRATSRAILTVLQKLSREMQKTIIMVTHDPEAAEFADRVFHFNKGELELAGGEK